MKMKLPLKLSLHTITLLLVILLQNLKTTHMLPLQSNLDLLLDPIYQSQLDDLESKIVVPKSVYNTVIRITNSPCQFGTQRVKEGGPCVPRYSSGGPVLDEEYQLSILKGITSFGGMGTRRPNNRNRNRHRTTTPPTTTTTMEPETPSSTQFQEGSTTHEDPVKTQGNIEVMDIDVDMGKTHSPQVEHLPPAQSSLSITSQPMSVSIPVPKQGPRPTLAPQPTLPSENDNIGISFSTTSATSSPIEASTTGIKAEESSEESLKDFPTMIPTMIEEVVNVTFDMDSTPNQKNDESVDDETISTTDVEKPLSTEESSISGHNVMVSSASENKVTSLVRPIITPIVSTQENKTESETSSGTNFTFHAADPHFHTLDPVPDILTSEPAAAETSESVPTPTSQSWSKVDIEVDTAPATTTPSSSVLHKTQETDILPVSLHTISTTTQTPLNFTDKSTDNPITDLNTGAILPVFETGAQNTEDIQKNIYLPSSSTLSTLIQINDFEIDPNSRDHEHHEAENKPDDEVSTSKENFGPGLSTMSFAQEILAKLQPHRELLSPSSKEQLLSFPSNERRRSDIIPAEVDLEEEPEILPLSVGVFPEKSQEAEIDKIHPRSRSRNRVKASEPEEEEDQLEGRIMSSSWEEMSPIFSTLVDKPSPTNLILTSPPPPPQHAAPLPKLFVGSSLDYQRLGSNYRRFRVF